jgi:hypothetical protein
MGGDEIGKYENVWLTDRPRSAGSSAVVDQSLDQAGRPAHWNSPQGEFGVGMTGIPLGGTRKPT